jgi:hypothetical protein
MSHDHEGYPFNDIERLHKFMDNLAVLIDQILNGKGVVQDESLRRNGFALMVFPYTNPDGRSNYISNSESREEIIELFRQQIRIFEAEQAAAPKVQQ